MPAPDPAAKGCLRQDLPAHCEPHPPALCGLTDGQESADLALLDRMYHIADTGCRCGNREGCLKGTGEEDLREVERCRWLTGEREQHIFWLNGLAGTGKSTIAQTSAETSFAEGELGASFLRLRDFENQNSL